MKSVRRLLLVLALALALAALLLATALLPPVQTWFAQRALAGQTGLQASVGSVSAGFDTVSATDLRLNIGGAVLTVPTLEASLPMKTAVRYRKLLVRRLVAKGWTLDLRPLQRPERGRRSDPGASASETDRLATAPVESVVAPEIARAFRGILRSWSLDYDLSLDDAELEGDVVIAAPVDREPVQVHLRIKGGGLAADRDGTFTMDASGEFADLGLPFNGVSAHGRLTIAMDSPRKIKRVAVQLDLTPAGRLLPRDLAIAAEIVAASAASEETYTLELSRGPRHVAAVSTRFLDRTGRWEGTWRVDIQDSDLVPLFPRRALPALAVVGSGDFDAEGKFGQIHAMGRLTTAMGRLGALSPQLEILGATKLDTDFELTHSGHSVHVARLSVALAGARPVVTAHALQPFDCDERTGAVKVADPKVDWLDGELQEFPLTWLPQPAKGFALIQGGAKGGFLVHASEGGGFTVRSTTALTASGVALQRAGRILASDLDLSLSLNVGFNSAGWQMQWAPLIVSRLGRTLGTVEASAAGTAVPDQPTKISGKWKADLAALASLPSLADLGPRPGQSASGEFTATVGNATILEGKCAVTGSDPTHVVTVSGRADVDADGGVSFYVPIKIAFGADVSELAAEGTWSGRSAAPWSDIRVTGGTVALDHLRVLAVPLRAASAVLAASEGVSSQVPFWGSWVGRMRLEFEKLKVGDRTYTGTAGNFAIDPTTVRLKNGRGALAVHSVAKIDGEIGFDVAAAQPYSLKASGSIDEFEAAPLFGPQKPDTEPAVKGRFSLTGALTGRGANLDELLAHLQEEYRLTSPGGVIRLLKTDVGTTTPEAPAPVSDALVNTGTFVGSLFRVKPDKIDSGTRSITKTASAVLNFTYQVAEFPYDEIAVTATRGPDRILHLNELTVTSANVHLTGSGQINYTEHLPFGARPLSVDLQLGGKGRVAELLAEAGLLTAQKDSLGYAIFSQPLHFGGSLETIDSSQWHDLLAKAKVQPDRVKK